jgi:hypothetical protein
VASDDIRTAITVAQALWGVAVFIFTLGGLAMWVKLRIAGHDKRIEKLETDISKTATKEDIKTFKEDIIREMYTLHGVERRDGPR